MPSVIQRIRELFFPTYQINIDLGQNVSVEGMTPRRLYATQANLHAVVSFLADSIAQLPLKVYVRDGENKRRRDRESAAALLLYRPNKDQTAYEFFNSLAEEYFLFGVATVWLLPDPESESGWQLRIIPREWIKDYSKETLYAPDTLIVSASNRTGKIEIPKEDYTMFRMYSPGDPNGWQSPIAALKQTLTEQIQADKFRTEIWRSSGRFNAYLTRPANVQPWDDQTRTKFVTAFRNAWASGGENSGKMPLLEDGMEIKPYQFNAQQAQYTETKQLSREDVAAAYHVNPSLIWHSSTQTYASAKDNARALYADCLGPVLQMIQQRINSFLLPKIGADPGTYVVFDMSEKLKGSFEERASILQSSVGGPFMTRNEARADYDLPPLPGGDELIVPLNVVEGGQASPQDTHMESSSMLPVLKTMLPKSKSDQIRIKGRSTKEEDERVAEVLSAFFKRQRESILPKIGAKAAGWWNQRRWDAELADDLEPVLDDIADAHGKEVAKALGSEYHPEQTRNYIRALAEGRAKAINDATYKKLMESTENADEEEDELDTPAHVFDLREGSQANLLGRSLAIGIAGWAATHEAPNQAERQGIHKMVEKIWVTGDNPRPEHAMMDGETVPIWETFSNGCNWPGDDDGDPDTTCGCNCSTEILITGG
jgi:HK97 family phage portal protein